MTVGGAGETRLTWKLFDFRPFVWPTNNHLISRLATPSRIFLGAIMRIEEPKLQLIEYSYLEGDHHPSTAGQFIRPLEQLRFLHSHSLVHGDIHRGNIVFGKKSATSLFPGAADERQICEFKRTLESKSKPRARVDAGATSSASSSAVAIPAAADDDAKYERPSSSLIDFDMIGIAGLSHYASNFRWEFGDPAFGQRRRLANDQARCMFIEDDAFSMWYLMQLYCVSDAGASSDAVSSDSNAAQVWQAACGCVECNDLSGAIKCLLAISDVSISLSSVDSDLSAAASNMHQDQGSGSPDRKPTGKPQPAVQNQRIPRSRRNSSKSNSTSQQSSLASIAEAEPKTVAAAASVSAAQ